MSAIRLTACLLLAAAAAAGPIGCGDDDESGSNGGAETKAKPSEKAFLTAMVSHHESALEMSEIAADRGQDPFITKLAAAISSTQNREIERMEKIHTRLFGDTLRPDPGAHDGLGLSAAEAGMTHSADTTEMLRSAKPFDRAFVDEMVPHHEGAVRMANVVLKETNDAPLRRLAMQIITTQRREIAAMNQFRTKKFGGPVPEGAGHGKESKGKPEGEDGHGAGHSG